MLKLTTLQFFHLLDLTLIERYHAARFQKETRYYVACLNQDLLNDWTIVVTNGRVNSKLGKTRTIAFQNFSEAFDQFCLIAKTRHQRGYRCTNYRSDASLFFYLLAVLTTKEEAIVLGFVA